MIIIKLQGGLGNQMFQYALGRKLEIRNGYTVKYDFSFFKNQQFRTYDLHYFGLDLKKASGFDLLNAPNNGVSFSNKWKYLFQLLSTASYLKQDSFGFDSRFLNPPKKAYLEGYWQTEKYFKDIRSYLLDDFRFHQKVVNENEDIKHHIRETNSVSVHFRRGDYLANTTKIFQVCDWNYYVKGIELIATKIKNPYFFIFSDEPDWCKTNIQLDFPFRVVDVNKVENNYLDMYLMSECKHNIIANSSFSWWGAWLNKNEGKLVVAPRDWFEDKSIHTADIIPTSWISI